MMLPKPRGPLSAAVFESMRAIPAEPVARAHPEADGPEDAAITLWALYELAYRGFDDVDDTAEWDPDLLAVRRALEVDLEARLRTRWESYTSPHEPRDDFADDFFAFIGGHDGRSLARFVQTEADEQQVLDLFRLRSVYHLKEADPTAFVVPRLPTAPKAALMELQYDEYGSGDPNRLHSHLFVSGMEAIGLRSEYGAYVDDVPVEVLEQNNAMSLLGLHRRLRGAALGHLAAFEATSSVPSRQMAQGLDRLGMAREMIDYYDEHVEADAVHEQLAVRAICGALLAVEPELRDDVYFGAFACLDLEDRLAETLLARWGVGT
ncbi:iron-containing redox enzyme family protein [Nocardioides sp. cx-169]|uniref:iron-containing redox enzyme family protein n=1 Tax=Nocardioides sp. cx-169 TaxID=2899080 RepID=UPI001E6181EE|nr:iron-containing redox enzyme family protein [Nocardioides sp. cx-169]MCD4534552.1 iron-containing redox enzyme family protein [Nocardioides sp. cx-169]